jgi:nitrogen fixation protein NifU and related proteins
MYSPQVLEHFQNPRNVGEVDAADAAAEVQNPACGDILRLSLKLDAAGRVQQVRFRARGCVPSIACGSRLTEMMAGLDPASLRALRRETLVESLGGLPDASAHASHLAFDALREILKELAERPASR